MSTCCDTPQEEEPHYPGVIALLNLEMDLLRQAWSGLMEATPFPNFIDNVTESDIIRAQNRILFLENLHEALGFDRSPRLSIAEMIQSLIELMRPIRVLEAQIWHLILREDQIRFQLLSQLSEDQGSNRPLLERFELYMDTLVQALNNIATSRSIQPPQIDPAPPSQSRVNRLRYLVGQTSEYIMNITIDSRPRGISGDTGLTG